MIGFGGRICEALEMAGLMIHSFVNTVAQIAATKLQADTPRVEPVSPATTWIAVGVLAVVIIGIAFKTARRNNTLEDNQ